MRMERHPHGTIADSFGLLDLAAQRFDLLFAATWLHHPGVASAGPTPGWTRVLDSDLMARWNQHHDTVGVLPFDLWAHPRFTVLARHDGDHLTGGAILHDAGPSSDSQTPGPPRTTRSIRACCSTALRRPTPVGPSWTTPGVGTSRPCSAQASSRWVRSTFGFR